MKKPVLRPFLLLLVFVSLTLLSTSLVSRAGTVAAPYEIGTWEGFRQAAISYTFDDNVTRQYSIAVPMFHTNGFKITLFTVIDSWTGFTWSMAQTAASYGDEIASHTVTHANLTTVSPAQLTNELANSQSIINSHITNESCVTIAYPNCAVPNEATVAQYYIAARGCAGILNSSTPSDFYNINSYVLGSAGSYTTAASIENLANSATNSYSWCVYLIHSLDVNDDYSPLSSAVLQATVNYFSTNQDKFWVETFGNVVRYIKERDASSVTETADTGSSITIQVTNDLTNPIHITNTVVYNYPITIRRPLPANWSWAVVTQNGEAVPSQVVTNDSTHYIMFDVVPNGGDVTITQTNAPWIIQLAIPAGATEGDGVLAGQGSITVNPAPSSDLVVDLTSSDTGKVTVPASVVIPAGQTNATFDLTIIDNTLLDGDQSATITAVATDYGAAQAAILVHDNDTATLTVTLPATAEKGAGTLTNAGLVSASSVVLTDYTVSLVSSDTSKLTVPSSVVISNGQSSVPFNLTVLGDTLIDGPRVVTVTAHVPYWTDGSNSMTILDNNALPDHFGWGVVPSPQTAGQPFNVTITAYDATNNQVNYLLPVNLSAWAPGTGPATNSLLGSPGADDSLPFGDEYVLGYSFTPDTNLVVTAVRSYFGDKVSLWTDNGVLLASQDVTSVPGTWVETPLANAVVLFAGVTYRVGVHVTSTDDVYVDYNLATNFPDGTINEAWYSYASGNAFPDQPDAIQYLVDLTYGTNVESLSISPVVSGDFNYGTWSGNLTVLEPAASVTLEASVSGSSGQSRPFDVQLGMPILAITPVGGSMVISWTAAATGYTLEETHDLLLGSWMAVPGSPVVIDNNYVLTNAPSATTTFYRLHKLQ